MQAEPVVRIEIKAPSSWADFMRIGTSFGPGYWSQDIYAGRLSAAFGHRIQLEELPYVGAHRVHAED